MLKKSKHATRKLAKWFQSVTQLSGKSKAKRSKTRASARRKKHGAAKRAHARVGKR